VKEHRLAVRGSHDRTDMAEALEKLGFEVLINRSTTLARQGQRIVVAGLDDVHSFFTPARCLPPACLIQLGALKPPLLRG